MPHPFRRSQALIVLAAAMLAACGGGGGGGSGVAGGNPTAGTGAGSGGGGSTGVAPGAPSATAAQPVVVTGLSIAAGDVLAETEPLTRTAALGKRLERWIFQGIPAASAFANAKASANSVNQGNAHGWTNQSSNGQLVSLNVRQRGKDGTPVQCEDDTAEVRIERTWRVVSNRNHVLVRMTYPTLINADGTVSPAFNTSPNTLLVYASGMIRELAIGTGAPTLTDLSAEALPIRTSFDGQFAYDGTHLVGRPKDRNDVALIFTKGTGAIRLVPLRGSNTADVAGIDGAFNDPGASIFIDARGRFVWYEAGTEGLQRRLVGAAGGGGAEAGRARARRRGRGGWGSIR